ncbi:MAG TPA: alpha-2-macroglobulin family protein, partial [Xanthomonadaceae bacterium]|nr:alpha-2-macroglobulin family protein [Xanthomonadaceae bacterium]
TVDSQPLMKPGQVLHMHVKTAEPSRVAVFAVDEGILQVAHYKLADPLDFFFRKRMLEVQTTQILDLILPEFTRLAAMASPGGDADNMIGRFLNPFRKKHAPPVAYWSGLVDVNGEKDLTWTVPEDFNGKLRVMAVAVSAGKIGTFEGATTVRGDFVLSPNVPSVVAPGDVFEVSVGVANNLTGLAGKSVPVNVSVALSPQLEAVGGAQQSVTLAERSEGVVLFHLRAKPSPGAATLVFTASSGAHAAKLTQQMSVRPAVPFRTEMAIGNMGKTSVDIKPLRAMFEQHAQRDAAASHVPLVLARGLAAYLENFPHLCTEQLLSQGVPALVFDKHPEFGGQVTGAGQTPTARFDALLGVLRSRQNAEGGFGLWTATPESERYISAYAVQYLLEAKERGHTVPADMLDRANGYLMQLSADDTDSTLAGLRERAFAVYLLTRQGKVMTGQLAAVRQRLQERHAAEWKEDIAAAYLAASLKLVKADKEADQLIAGPEKLLNRAAFDAAYNFDRYNDPLVRDSGTLYLLAKHFPDRAKALPAQSLQNIVLSLQHGWYNTLSSAMTILALDAYADQIGPVAQAQLTIAQLGANGIAKPISKVDGLVVRGNFDGAAQAVRVSNGSDLATWYSVSQAGFDRALPTAARKDGIEIVRDYTDADGKPITNVSLGQEIQVHLKIRSTRADGVGNVAIVDLLPGGFEPVQETRVQPGADTADADKKPAAADSSSTAAATPAWQSPVGISSSTWMPEYADVRDDRVVIYGTATTDVREFVYRIKSTNAGTYAVPPAYGESMYDRTVVAQSLGGTITVERKP